MTAEAGRFAGLERFQCRREVVRELEEAGMLLKTEDHKHAVGHCYRCKNVVEPNLSQQWFVKVKPLAQPAIEAVESGKTRIVPESWAKTYFEWMYNIKDWCISRQIWWGHQIPAWTCEACGEMMVAMTTPEACVKCGSTQLTQESDVLDTWFSSALWPFSTMGWPEQTELLRTFYPTSVLVTGFDILFFWVARMMMMGIHFMGEVPFRDVYVHALVRDEEGKKMSKSKGNVIDPLSVIDEYGTDAFRYTLAAFAAQGRDVKMSAKRVEGYRHFINKLWNAARFAFMHLDRGYEKIEGKDLSLADRWILARLDKVAQEVGATLDGYKFNEAAGFVYQFIWHEFCDWYLEASKSALYNQDNHAAREAARQVLWTVLRDALILMHPFAPFVTEEIWSKLPGSTGSIMNARFPRPGAHGVDPVFIDEAERSMGWVMAVITAIRNIRGEMNIAPSARLQVILQTHEADASRILKTHGAMIANLAMLSALNVTADEHRSPTAATAIADGVTIQVELKGIIDFAQEIQRLQKELQKLDNELAVVDKKLGNEGFLAKAPPEVVEEVKAKQATIAETRAKIDATLQRVKKFV
jgi:valyl-tRNA synthetase